MVHSNKQKLFLVGQKVRTHSALRPCPQCPHNGLPDPLARTVRDPIHSRLPSTASHFMGLVDPCTVILGWYWFSVPPALQRTCVCPQWARRLQSLPSSIWAWGGGGALLERRISPHPRPPPNRLRKHPRARSTFTQALTPVPRFFWSLLSNFLTTSFHSNILSYPYSTPEPVLSNRFCATIKSTADNPWCW